MRIAKAYKANSTIYVFAVRSFSFLQLELTNQ